MEEKNVAADLLKFQINRCLTNQSKSFLVVLEDLLEETQGFNYNKRRKVVLDNLNNNIREIENLLLRLDIKLK